MAYFLLASGVILAWLDYQGAANLRAAGSLVYDEAFGSNDPFYKWLGALVIIGLIGFVP